MSAGFFRAMLNGDKVSQRKPDQIIHDVLREMDESERLWCDTRESRFYIKYALSAGIDGRKYPPAIVQVPYFQVRNDFESSHISGDDPENYFWMDDDFNLHPVKCGNSNRHAGTDEKSIYYGDGSLVANGQCVGEYGLIDA